MWKVDLYCFDSPGFMSIESSNDVVPATSSVSAASVSATTASSASHSVSVTPSGSVALTESVTPAERPSSSARPSTSTQSLSTQSLYDSYISVLDSDDEEDPEFLAAIEESLHEFNKNEGSPDEQGQDTVTVTDILN